MKAISGRDSSLKRATSKNFTVFLGSFIFVYKKLIIAVKDFMEVQRAHLICISAKHVYIKADSVLKSHLEKLKSTSKVLGGMFSETVL